MLPQRASGASPVNRLLAAIAVLPLIAGGALAAKSAVLWEQDADSGLTVNSQSSGGDGDAAADDFVVPAGQTWLVKEVDVTGVYFNSTGPAASEVVTFYSNRKGLPHRIQQGPFTLNCTDNAGSFQCVLPKRVKLRSGTWWVSFVTNCDFNTCGEWGWDVSATVHSNEAVWENPPGGGACASWQPLHVCFGGAPADLAFRLIGRAMVSN
jgi:hypothetical protein